MNNYPNGNSNAAARSAVSCCGFSYGVLCFLILVFALALGLILGAVFYETLLPVLAAVIAFAAAILVAIIALLIYRYRRNA